MEEAIVRGWVDLIRRLDGPMHLRFIVQPAVAIFLGLRAGLRDARAGEPPFVVALRDRERRRERLRHAWSDIGKVFVVSVVLDAIYQVWVQHGIFLFELLLTATLLALVPYGLVRGPTRRIARAWHALRTRDRCGA
ncbi:MAG: hypothetical protein K0S65_2558 [Labilithrix sp.]|nr:hypothetical protein [Labilithrix sp.]